VLNSINSIGSEDYFVVQFEREIWPIGFFQVPKISHEILSWVFHQNHILALIETKEASQKLQIPEVGDFAIEWYVSTSMKNIKCMHNIRRDSTHLKGCKFPYIPLRS